MAILRLLIFDKGSWYAKKSLYTLFSGLGHQGSVLLIAEMQMQAQVC